MTASTITSATALFTQDGPDRWIPTELARGPWDAQHCRGGPVSALLARAIEQIESTGGIEWQITRLTVELIRPVPVGQPLTLSTEIERPGRRVSLVAARLADGDREVARVRCLRIRRHDLMFDDDMEQPPPDPPGDAGSGQQQSVEWAVGDHIAFHKDACEHRFTESSWDIPGPVGVWIRLLVPVVEGETPSGVQRVAAAADFGNGVSGALPFEEYAYINPDLTIHLIRPPVGEWIGMRAASYYGKGNTSTGSGIAESALYDLDGRLGRSVQSLLIDRR